MTRTWGVCAACADFVDGLRHGMCERCYCRRRYEENRDRILVINRAWRARNPDYFKQERFRKASRERRRAWVLANPQEERERHRETTSRRRARLSQVPVGDREALRNYRRIIDGDPCSYCGAVSDSVDHIIPLSRGGGHSWDNLTAACIRCNSRKFNLPLLTFLHYAPQTGQGEEPDR